MNCNAKKGRYSCENDKKIKMDMWINVFMMLLIGILFIVRPQDSLEVAAMIAGAVIVANGIF